MLLRAVLCGGVWNGFFLEKARGEKVQCWFCGGDDGDGHFLSDCRFPPVVHVREQPEFLPSCVGIIWNLTI